MLRITAAEPADLDAVLSFWKVATTEPSATDDRESLLLLLDEAPGSLLLATDDGRIVGTVIVGWDGWRGTLYRLAVAPDHRRRGIATMLVREGEAVLRERGATRLHLIVAADQPAARAFWSAIGYESTDQVRFVKTVNPRTG